MKRYIIGLLFIMMHVHALKLDRVILATDAHPDYIEFWPTVAKAWQNMGIKPTLALIAHADVQIDESLGDVVRVEPIDGIPTSFQAQTIRLLLPTLYPDDGCILSDIDMIPLNRAYFVDSVAHCPDDSFVVYRDKAYHEHEQKYPMCYLAAQGSTFQEIFHVATLSGIRKKIQALYDLDLGWNTDELMLYYYVNEWKDFETRCVKLGHGVQNRVDRSHWVHDSGLLRSGHYIDAHCPRPYSRHKKSIDKLVSVQNNKLSTIKMYPYNESMLRACCPLGDLEITGEINIIRSLIHEGDVVFDVGANCGDWTREVLAHTQPRHVYAFEPLPSIASAFKENIQHERVTLHELALFHNRGHASFHYYPRYEGICDDGTLSSLYRRSRAEAVFNLQGYEINVTTERLDAFCAEHGVDRINFLKIDSEGAECDILQGALELLQKQKIDFIQFEYGQTYTDSKRTLKEAYDLLTHTGYTLFKIHRDGIVHVKSWFDWMENFYQSNYLAVSADIIQNSDDFEALIAQDRPKKRYLEFPDSGTHMSFFLTAVAHTNGPILELGAGDYSTPLLHAVCSREKRYLMTADTSMGLLCNFLDLQRSWHAFCYVPVYEDDLELNAKPERWDNVGGEIDWSVVIVNHRPGERRVKDIERLRSRAEIFVIHDTQERGYGYQSLIESFKYVFVDERYAIQTTLVSDTIDVSQFFN